MAREDATIVEKIASDLNELQEKVVRLTAQLSEVEAAKKAANKDYNDQIKDIKTEIKMSLDLLKEAENG